MDKITIRPSSVQSAFGCAHQWLRTFIYGEKSMPSARAALGTGVHAGVEDMWNESIHKKEKIVDTRRMIECGLEAYDKEVEAADGKMYYDDDIDDNIAHGKIISGVKQYAKDIVPFTDIPEKVETRVSVSLDHLVVNNISGTIDYIGNGIIADIKTSKRKIIPASYVIQQSIYKILAEAEGHDVKYNFIQGVVFNAAKTKCSIDDLEPNIPQAKYLVENLLDRLTELYAGGNPKFLFPGNPKSNLCSHKFCSLYPCEYVTGENEVSNAIPRVD